MDVQLLVNLRIVRSRFIMENYLGSQDIFALIKSGSFVFESEEGRHTAGEDEGVLFRRGVLYRRRILSPVTMYFFRYESGVPVFAEDHIRFADKARIRSTLAMLEKLDRGVYRDEFAHRQRLFEDIINQYAVENGAQSVRRDDPIEAAIGKISETLHRKLVLSEIAGRSGLSYVQFLRRFQAYTGMTPTDYVAALRMQKAKQLLGESELLIREIAPLCGFENEYYFSNFFKKHAGMSPSAFRALL